jgi:hypothetical protein
MKIETKFKVNDLLKGKYDYQGEDVIMAMEVIEISTVTCCAGTQIFYTIRQIMAQKEFKKPYDKSSEYFWKIGHAIMGSA